MVHVKLLSETNEPIAIKLFGRIVLKWALKLLSCNPLKPFKKSN